MRTYVKTWLVSLVAGLLIAGAALPLTGQAAASPAGGAAGALNFVGERYEKSAHPLSETTLTIIHDSHFHGNFYTADDALNIANYFGLINHIREKAPHSLVIFNGDDTATSLLSTAFQGQHMIDALNAMKIDIDTFGNHDFDMGPDQLKKLVGASKFPWVSANVVDKDGNMFAHAEGAKPYIVKEVNGVKVGLTGLITEETPAITTVGDNVVLNPVEAMKQVVPQMKKDGAELIIVASHLASPEARIVAQEVDGIDLIVGDHAAFAYEMPEKINDTLLWFIGDEYTYLGEINLQVKDGGIADFNYRRYTLEDEVKEEGFKPDPAVLNIMNDYNGRLEKELETVIGKTDVELNMMKAVQRQGETPIGNYVADTVREYIQADAVIVGGGDIRADYVLPPGPITKRNVMETLPFQNYLVKLELTGEVLRQALENGVSEIESGAGRFPQVSGIEFSFNPNLPQGFRVVDVKVGGKPLDPKGVYTLGTTDYLAEGGDSYDMLTKAKVLVDGHAGPLISLLVLDRIQEQGAIAPKIEGRIVRTHRKPEGYPAFADIEGHPYLPSIVKLYAQGVARGQNDTAFAPDEPITRAQFAALLTRIVGPGEAIEPSAPLPYQDVENGDWHYEAIRDAYRQGLMQGVTEDRFAPADPITKDELRLILQNALKVLHIDADADSLMEALKDAEAKDRMTRAQAAAALDRLIGVLDSK
ncbi:5'-nucleotidase C-terminal domain-containing protein [Paenibacillus sp. MSJ-34]|uniref:5'-nucleotidase C-terminal domain-containing protein n=1 Tax=Paenibacillus sp. MSJ-34 TaxID=2841529 RepID=UPI001C108327|nr:5'-nucleotidase C-terminal domain-containing protein [Paenibacillus sp. MSJ-34]MBU5441931.1 5'-nucleotidase C-terminal domain-containing protein [Paenibacillus sp. MSJ-34]